LWTVVYIAPDEATALEIQGKLVDEGILARIRRLGAMESPRKFDREDTKDGGQFEVLVPEGEVEEASEILVETFGR